ncbi:FecR family protein [Pinibacter soli]|uniref:FecR family protein n=1 Tax=Pinibacter soli TaxID=3044211 RepID=A0ABT6R889_9BACT|nr:FecR family protein [Pinibacter soli]MDI3318776.1 FecR family protein [Pinibacter soli]
MFSKFFTAFLLTGFVVASCHNTHKEKEEDKSKLEEKEWKPAGSLKNYKCVLGARKIITLPDGTTVTLGSSSTITVPDDFNKLSREIGLIGNALIEVVKDSSKPFIIHTRHLQNTTTGGTYWIIAPASSEGETVEVVSGTLHANKAYPSQFNEPEILKAGEMVMINHTIDLMEKETFDTTEINKWKSNVLVFNNATVSEFAKELENWFGISVTLNGDFSKLPPITYTFTQATLQQILETINKSHNIKYSLEEESLVLKK